MSDELQDNCAWLGELIGIETPDASSLLEGFVLLQLLSLISPNSVDLGWYATPAAFECPNLPLRNHAVLAKAIKNLKKFSNSEDSSRPGTGDWIEPLNEISDMDLVNAKAGEIIGCAAILAGLKKTFEAKLKVGVVVASELPCATSPDGLSPLPEVPLAEKSEAKVNSRESSASGDPYSPADRIFLHYIDWILTIDKDECASLLRGRLEVAHYNRVFGEMTEQAILVNKGFTYLVELMDMGYLNIQPSMVPSVKEMVQDVGPFYESLHANIITALMACSYKNVTIESIVAHLTNFKGFDASKTYPFDMEDGMLIWMNQCIASSVSNGLKMNLAELEELGREFDERTVLVILSVYFPKIDIPVNDIIWDNSRSIQEKSDNEDNLRRLLEAHKLPLPQWSFLDFEGELQTRIVPLYMYYLVQLFQQCQPLLPHSRKKTKRTMRKELSPVRVHLTKHATEIPHTVLEPIAEVPPSQESPCLSTLDLALEDTLSETNSVARSEPELRSKQRLFRPVKARLQKHVQKIQSPISEPLTLKDEEPLPLKEEEPVPLKVVDPVQEQSIPSALPQQEKDLIKAQDSAVELHESPSPRLDEVPVIPKQFELEMEMEDAPNSPEIMGSIRVATHMASLLLHEESDHEIEKEDDPEIVNDKDVEEHVHEPVYDVQLVEQEPDVIPFSPVPSEAIKEEEFHVPIETPQMVDDESSMGIDEPPAHIAPPTMNRPPQTFSRSISKASLSTKSETKESTVPVLPPMPAKPSVLSFSPPNVPAKSRSHSVVSAKSRPQSILLQSYPIDETEMEAPLAPQKLSLPPIDEKFKESEENWNRVQKTKGVKLLEQSEIKSPEPKSQKQKKEKLEVLRERKELRDFERRRQKQEHASRQEGDRQKFIESSLQSMQERATQRASKRESPTKSPSVPKGLAPLKTGRRPVISKIQSNRALIKNALMHVCLAGSVKAATKLEVLEDLESCNASHYIILFRERNHFSFRGLYKWDASLDQTVKIFSGSLGPDVIPPEAVLEYYKYDSGARTFKPVPTTNFCRSVHAVAIAREYWTKLSL